MRERELPLRIIVVQPPEGVTFQMQRGQGGKVDLVPPTHASQDSQSFDFALRVGERPNGQPNFLGPFVQGPQDGRFVYINSGTLAGQADSCWTRRAKVHLSGITRQMIEQALADPDAILEARIWGLAKDGGPACATVPILDGGWQISRKNP
ncbi:MAG TPA: DUF5990 family protein [Thermoanaerobaculia bacterium]